MIVVVVGVGVVVIIVLFSPTAARFTCCANRNAASVMHNRELDCKIR